MEGELIVGLVALVLASGYAGMLAARSENKPPVVGFLLGAAIPILGIGLVRLIKSRKENRRARVS
jgi:hypothetical protein